MDVVGDLPLELSQWILSFLEPEELGRCLAVSKAWRRAANTDFLWSRFCPPSSQEATDAAGNTTESSGELCKWAHIYISCYHNVRINWQRNRFKTVEERRWGEYNCTLICSRDLLVVAYSSGLVEVFSIPALELVQRFEIRIPGREMLTLRVENDLLTLTKANITLLYRRLPRQTTFTLEEALAVNDMSVVSTREMGRLEEWMEVRLSAGTLWEGRLLLKGSLWLRQCSSAEFLVWDSRTSTSVADIRILFLTSNSDYVFAAFASTVIVFTPQGRPRLVVDLGEGVRRLVGGEGEEEVVGGLESGEWRVLGGGWECRLPPEGRLAWGPAGRLLHVSPASGALLLTAWHRHSPLPLFATRHEITTTRQVPTLTRVVLVLKRFLFCHFVARQVSQYVVFNAVTGSFLYSSKMNYGFVEHVDDNCVLSLTVNMEGTRLLLRRFDLTLHHN